VLFVFFVDKDFLVKLSQSPERWNDASI